MKIYLELKDILKEHFRVQREETYNIFRVLEVSQKEVMMCRFLADLLNPDGKHGQGIWYLKLFMEQVLHRNLTDRQLSLIQMYKEYPIKDDRRIDLVLQSPDMFLPMEVKIHAGEQKSQCYDYYQYAKRTDKNTKVLYLTKYGDMPGPYSLCSADGQAALSEDKIVCISFAEDITAWLEKILEEEQGEIAHMIRQYLEAVRDFTGEGEKKRDMEIADKILEKEEYFRMALDLEKSMKTVKAGLLSRVLQEFEIQMEPLLEELGLEKENRFYWYEYGEQATEDFYNTYSTYPGIDYVIKNVNLRNDLELWFRIEVEHCLFAGVCVFDPNADSAYGRGNQVDDVSEELEEEVLQYLNLDEIKKGSWWLTWWYLPTGTDKRRVNAESVPDFKAMNEKAVQLSDETCRKAFVQECVCVTRRILKQVLGK